jgi:hypothetical protein
MTKQEPFMPIAMPEDDSLVKLKSGEIITWAKLRERMEAKELEWINYLFGDSK